MENTTDVKIIGCDFSHIGGNAVFLSNSVSNSVLSSNMFEYLGTSGVAVQGARNREVSLSRVSHPAPLKKHTLLKERHFN
jgi:hypothetical protein